MQSQPAIVIVGPGAMGCLHAALLAEGGANVALLDHRPERAARLQAQGVRLTFPDGAERTIPVPCTAQAETLGVPELVIILTKAYHTEAALATAGPLLTARPLVLTLQNGLGNHELLQRRLLPAQVLAGTTAAGATLLAEGHLRVAGISPPVLGSPCGETARAQAAARLLRRGGLAAEATADVEGALWRKAILNAAINPLGALTGRANGELLDDPALRALLGEVAREAHRVALEYCLTWGSAVADFDPAAEAEQVCRATAPNLCSMLQDVRAGRRTEIEQISGEIVRRADQVDLPAPLNRALVALVRGRSPGGEA